jgi:hypothetical protein
MKAEIAISDNAFEAFKSVRIFSWGNDDECDFPILEFIEFPKTLEFNMGWSGLLQNRVRMGSS